MGAPTDQPIGARAELTTGQILRLLGEDLTPRRILTREALENAIVIHSGIGARRAPFSTCRRSRWRLALVSPPARVTVCPAMNPAGRGPARNLDCRRLFQRVRILHLPDYPFAALLRRPAGP